MTGQTSNTALILFTRSVSEEVKYKKFSPTAGRKGNILIAQKLLTRATSLAEQADIDFFVFTEKEQTDGSFGQRLSQAYQETFDKGYKNVISIGNDSPDLNLETLKKAIDQLDHDQAVIGPSSDGGVYLLGLSQEHFDQEIFVNLRWQTGRLARDIADQLLLKFDISWLKTLHDIDHASDFYKFLKGSQSALKWILINLLGLWSTVKTIFILNIKEFSPSEFRSERGPPSTLLPLL
ncbi:MAG: DUF2064 domain-containing protein [Bacteroidota bacterium]